MIDTPIREAGGLAAKLVLGRSERRARARSDFIGKFDDYVAAMTVWANLIGSAKSNEARSKLGQAFDWLAGKWDLLSSDAQDELTSRMLFPGLHRKNEEMVSEFIRTQTRLGTIAPTPVREAMRETSWILIDWSQDPTTDRTDEWLEARKALQGAADQYLQSRLRRFLRAFPEGAHSR